MELEYGGRYKTIRNKFIGFYNEEKSAPQFDGKSRILYFLCSLILTYCLVLLLEKGEEPHIFSDWVTTSEKYESQSLTCSNFIANFFCGHKWRVLSARYKNHNRAPFCSSRDKTWWKLTNYSQRPLLF